MNSVKIRVPRNLIKRLYSHAEQKYEGYFFADLVNGVHLELFYVEEGAFEDNYNLSTLVILNNDCFIKREIINTYETTQIYLYGNEDSITEQFLRKFANGKVKIKPESYKIYEEFGVYYLIHYYDAGIVVGYNDDWITEEVHILDKIGPCVINHIEERAFYGASKIKKLHMPNSIVMLGNSFLDETLNLEEVYIDANSKILNKLQKIIKEPVKLVLK